MKLEEAKEATVSAVIVLPTIADEPSKVLTIRLDSKSRAVTDPVAAVFVSVIHQTLGFDPAWLITFEFRSG